jgi:hypothetical protein
MSDIPNKPVAAEVRCVDKKGAVRMGYKFVAQTAADGSQRPPGLDLPANGVLASFVTPADWKSFHIERNQIWECSPEGDDNVSVYFASTARPVVNLKDRSELNRLICHDHKFTATEVAWLQGLLNANGTEKLTVSSARSHNIQGEQLLDVTGQILYPGKTYEFRSIFVDVDFTCNYLQEIHYVAMSKELFDKYYKQADGLFNSMVFAAVIPPFRNRAGH